jgi:hypothetical protein
MFNVFKIHCAMKRNEELAERLPQQIGNQEQDELEGYPLYPEEEDIYLKGKRNRKLNPDDVLNFTLPEKPTNKKNPNEDSVSEDLDLLEVEADEEVQLGIEDEENNYFSLGGDDHNDLEENLE